MNTHLHTSAAAGRSSTASASAGFTLVELMATLTIAAILMSAAIPSLSSLLQSVHLSNGTNTFLSSLRLARSEALRRGGRVTMCKSADGLVCAETGGWEQGWMIFHDPNGNSVVDEGETVVQHSGALEAGYRFTGNQPVARGIAFVGNGGNRRLSGGLQAGTLTLCKTSLNPTEARKVVMSSGGRPRVEKGTVAECV